MDMQALEAFETQVQADEALRTMLADITQSVASIEAAPATKHLGLADGLWLVGLVALWQCLQVGIQHLRGLSDTQLAARQIDLIARVQALGGDTKHATQVVERLLKGIRTRPDDDAVVKKLLSLSGDSTR